MDCSLLDYINKFGQLSEDVAARVLQKVASGLHFIHQQGFIHFDIKSGNILLNLDKNGDIRDVKIADFGLCTDETADLLAGRDTQGTIQYMAPEMVTLNCHFDNRIEAWSLGILLCKMLTDRVPFDSGKGDA